jgi:hypothetical protein
MGMTVGYIGVVAAFFGGYYLLLGALEDTGVRLKSPDVNIELLSQDGCSAQFEVKSPAKVPYRIDFVGVRRFDGEPARMWAEELGGGSQALAQRSPADIAKAISGRVEREAANQASLAERVLTKVEGARVTLYFPDRCKV